MRKLYFFLLTIIAYSCYSQATVVKENLYLRTSIFQAGGSMLFAADTGAEYADLWVSDGTPAGTHVLHTFSQGMAYATGVGYGSYTPLVFNNALYFMANDSGNGDALWKSDGTEQGTVMIKYFGANVDGTDILDYPYFCPLNNELLFAADDGVHGVELWETDGTTAGTVMVKDIAADNYHGSQPCFLTNYNGAVYFSCYNETYGIEVWKSDGTADGTVILKDILPGTQGATNDGYGGSIDPQFCVSGNYLFFTARKDSLTLGGYLYRTDGSSDGTIILDTVNPKDDPLAPGRPFQADVNGTLMYIAFPQDSSNSNLYKSDGTPAGTVNVATNDSLVAYSNLFTFKGKLYFHGAAGYNEGNDGLCASDGTTGGTTLVTAFPYLASPPSITNFVDIGSSFLFNVELEVSSSEMDLRLAQSIGTPGGIVVFGGAAPISAASYYNGNAYFWGLDTITEESYSFYQVSPSTTLGIAENKKGDIVVTVFPNPAAESVNIMSSRAINENVQVRVYNLEGENIYSNILDAGSSKLRVDVSQWSSGIYLCTLLQNSNMQTMKVVVQH